MLVRDCAARLFPSKLPLDRQREKCRLERNRKPFEACHESGWDGQALQGFRTLGGFQERRCFQTMNDHVDSMMAISSQPIKDWEKHEDAQ